jgi:hypothetical protein
MKLGLRLLKFDVADPRLRCSLFRGQGSRDCLNAFHGTTVTRDRDIQIHGYVLCKSSRSR